MPHALGKEEEEKGGGSSKKGMMGVRAGVGVKERGVMLVLKPHPKTMHMSLAKQETLTCFTIYILTKRCSFL